MRFKASPDVSWVDGAIRAASQRAPHHVDAGDARKVTSTGVSLGVLSPRFIWPKAIAHVILFVRV